MNKLEVRKHLDTITKGGGVRVCLNNDDLSNFYNGDILIVAEIFKAKLEHQLTSFGLGSIAISNARGHTTRELIKPVIKDIKNPCHRCNGTGKMPFKHVENGVCFKCKGTGSNK